MKTQLRKEIDKEVKAQRRDGNTFMDRVTQGLAAGTILGLAFYELLRHIRAIHPGNMILAATALAFLLYMIAAPEFRKR